MYKKKEDLKLNKKQLIMHDLVNKPFFSVIVVLNLILVATSEMREYLHKKYIIG